MSIFIVLFIIAIVFIVVTIIYFEIGKYFYNISLNPKTDKKFVLGCDEKTEEQKRIKKEQQEWLDKNSSHIYINSTNNGKLKLHAYEILNSEKTNNWAIVIHGYMSNGRDMIKYAKKFFQKGCNLLIIDLRGHGLSEGDYIGMGYHDRLDVVDWINYIVDKNIDSKIILFGVSMGAATTMLVTGESLPSNVKLAISDCGYSSAWDEFAYKLKQLFKLPKFPILYAADYYCKKKAKYSFKEFSVIKQLEKSHIPTLFIHGDIDSFVPFEMLDIVYNSASCEKEKLIVKNAEHAMASEVAPELYWKTIYRFMDKYIV